ncbi:MAG: transposase [Thaumarchaeota archaeon]|jgi:putative transposase|nr:transposase [Nitrososphaerota archaeon]
MRRSNTVRIIAGKETKAKLTVLGKAFVNCWNEVNKLRLEQYKNHEPVDFNKTEKVVYEKFKAILHGANVQQVTRKNMGAWKSFFELSKKKKEGELPKWMKPKPPHKKKDNLFLLIRHDRYKIEGNEIFLMDFNLRLKFIGKLKWVGKQGTLEIFFDNARKKWYARIPMVVKVNNKPKGKMKAGIDLGVVNLATVAVEDGSWMIFKGGSVLSEFKKITKRILIEEKRLSRHGLKTSRKLEMLYKKRSLLLKNAREGLAREIVESLYDKGVGEIYVGYPKGIAQDKGNERNTNFWSYSAIIKRIKEVAEEYGIKVKLVDEENTSKTCSLCGEIHENGRIKRGLFKCPRTGKVINADLNGAINILHIPESVEDRGKWLKEQPLVYRWTNGAGWVTTSYEAMKMKAVNHEPVIRLEGTIAF